MGKNSIPYPGRSRESIERKSDGKRRENGLRKYKKKRKERRLINKVILMGRLVKNPDIRYTNGENQMCIARFTLAVNRKFKKKGEQQADFISCIAFGKRGEFVEKYFQQGTKIIVCGKIQTGSYTNRDGVKVYTTDVIVDEMDFAESKSSTESYKQKQGKPMQSAPIYNEPSAENQPPVENNDWMDIPDGIEEQLPFV